MTDAFGTSWREFLAEVDASRERLTLELNTLLSSVASATSELIDEFETLGEARLERGRLNSLENIFADYAERLLRRPIGRLSKVRTLDRLLRAFEDYRTDLSDAARGLPFHVEISPQQLISSVHDAAALPFRLKWAAWQDRSRLVPIRPLVAQGLDGAAWSASPAEGAVHLVFAQSVLGLLDPWQALRAHTLRQLKGESSEADSLPAVRMNWRKESERLQQQAAPAIAALERSLANVDLHLVARVIRGPGYPRVVRRRSKQRGEYVGYWARQSRAVRAMVETELRLVELGCGASELTRELVSGVAAERRAVLEELADAIRCLRAWKPGEDDPLPPASAQLTSARERIRQWESRLRHAAETWMPSEVESLSPRRSLPALRSPWKRLEPQRDFLDTIEPSAEPAETALQDLEADHKALLREIERAREVVRFSIQTSAEDGGSGDTLIAESIGNAASLLEHERDTLSAPMPAVESGLVAATANAFFQFHVAFEQGRVDLWSYLAREGAARALRRVGRILVDRGRMYGREFRGRIQRANHRLLVAIGWEAPLESALDEVVRWTYWEDRAAADGGAKSLPLIYQRLFRAQPVEDLRFLVGRETEMAALEEARQAWQAGRYAAVLIVGHRGSGKTSLVNCALSRSFPSESVVRGSFADRLVTAEAVQSFLAGLVGVEVGDLLRSLTREERVIVLEETARTYLRVIGGTAGVAELLRIVSLTNRKTLWIISIAAEPFRVLDAAVGMSRPFSHRINASSVEPDQIREAILQRHNLSGLRLEFAARPEGNRFRRWVQQETGLAESAEAAFFNVLYRQSGGIFRSAFHIWQQHIDRAEGGVLYMHAPHQPDHAEVVEGLTRHDLFTLQMIIQHGSLTPDEHARVFSMPLDASRATMEHLAGLGILEPEPSVPGLRVRPSAGMLVRGVLNAENLL